ncbi:hypothetical protein C8F01DRAFT_1262659 [Mycena amicta]|nr:hypothetical protein C8F01DRAFT_1262659 [Mycena amicta]
MRRLSPLLGGKPPRQPVDAWLKRTPDLPDLLSTSLFALKESADGFPPLKSAVGAVLALGEIAQRVKNSKSDARDIARRAEHILDVIAEAVPDGSTIPVAMLRDIERFTSLVHEICGFMEEIASARALSRVLHLNRNEIALQDFKSRLNDAYCDLKVASALRVERQQAEMAAQQIQLAAQQQLLTHQQRQTHIAAAQVVGFIEKLENTMPLRIVFLLSDSSTINFTFFGQPLNDPTLALIVTANITAYLGVRFKIQIF